MKKIYVIAGPTASGKTAVGVQLAHIIGGEVISADSMQIYKGMDIGTAKPTVAECEGIFHHMIDIVKPDVPYSAALYQQHARAAIDDVLARGKVPILCGGTGFYINAVLYDVQFAKEEENDPFREHFMDMAANHGAAYLHAQLQAADPSAAMAIHAHNIKRVARALSYISTTGLLFSEYNEAQKIRPPVYEAAFCCLNINRQALYERINERVITMFDAGLATEVAGLLEQGYHPGLVSMQGIGYKETARYILGECTDDETIATVQQNSRHYAKRQMTWFRHQIPQAHVISAEGRTCVDIAREIALV